MMRRTGAAEMSATIPAAMSCCLPPWERLRPRRFWAFAGQAHHVDRHLRGKNRPWRRGQERRRGPPGAGPETASPTGGRRRVGRRPSAPSGLARVGQPAAGSCLPGAPALPPWGSTAASVAGAPAPWGITQGPKVIGGRAPSHHPPLPRRDKEVGIAAHLGPVKQFWTVFHDNLYLAPLLVACHYMSCGTCHCSMYPAARNFRMIFRTSSICYPFFHRFHELPMRDVVEATHDSASIVQVVRGYIRATSLRAVCVLRLRRNPCEQV